VHHVGNYCMVYKVPILSLNKCLWKRRRRERKKIIQWKM